MELHEMSQQIAKANKDRLEKQSEEDRKRRELAAAADKASHIRASLGGGLK